MYNRCKNRITIKGKNFGDYASKENGNKCQ